MKLPRFRFTRRQVLRAALPVAALALIASVVAGRERPAGPIAELPKQADTRVRPGDDLDIERLFRVENEEKKPLADPFARKSFAPAEQAAAPAAPAKPAAPPLPFRYVGKMIEDGKLAVFLSRGEDSYSVRAGQKIDPQYRVDKVTQTQVVFTYLPLKTKQVLDIPAVN